MFNNIRTADYVDGRGTCIFIVERTRMVVFSRLDQFGNRVFDVVDYMENEHGAHVGTYYDKETAKNVAKR